MIYFIPFLLAILYRCRGGFSPFGTQLTRLVFWSLPWALFGLSVDWKLGALCGVGAFLGLLIPHGSYMNTRDWYDTLHMCLIGAIRGFFISLPLIFIVGWSAYFLVLGGALSGLGYWLGNRYQSYIPLNISFGGKLFISPAQGLSEVLAGFCYGLGAACMVLI